MGIVDDVCVQPMAAPEKPVGTLETQPERVAVPPSPPSQSPPSSSLPQQDEILKALVGAIQNIDQRMQQIDSRLKEIETETVPEATGNIQPQNDTERGMLFANQMMGQVIDAFHKGQMAAIQQQTIAQQQQNNALTNLERIFTGRQNAGLEVIPEAEAIEPEKSDFDKLKEFMQMAEIAKTLGIGNKPQTPGGSLF